MELLVFDIADISCGVRTEFVREVQRAVSLSSVPEAGRHVLGTMNLRGQLILVLDLRTAMGVPSLPVMPSDHFLVIQCGERLLAMRVDQARELVHVDESEMTAAAVMMPTAPFFARVACVGDKFIHVIDPARLSTLSDAAK